MISLERINLYFVLSCLTGTLLSYYAYTVELHAEADHNYVALCDISEHMSCTKAFSSKYGKGFGLIGKLFGEDSSLNQPNSFGGIFFYMILACLCLSKSKSLAKLQMVLSVISNVLSAYLAYILYFILYDFCVVCITTYVINAINLTLSILRWKRLSSIGESTSGAALKIVKKHH